MIADTNEFPELDKTKFEQRGTEFKLGIPVINAVSIGNSIAVGFGDGTVRFFKSGSEPKTVKAHKGVVLSMTNYGDYVLTGGDDGRFLKISSDGDIDEISNFGAKWVDYVASYKDTKVCSSGNIVYVWSKNRDKPQTLEHPSTVGGLAFDNKGKRLAVSRYGGVTVWKQNNNKWTSSNYAWKGSHGTVTFSPDTKYIVTAMQENQIHGWRINDKADLAMRGYPAKIKSFTWVGDTPYLATSGSSDAVCWPFDGTAGPMGRKPVCVANGGKELVTFVKALRGEKAVFTGFTDGSVLLAEIDESKKPIIIRSSTGSEVSTIVMSNDNSQILIGDMKGSILLSSLWSDN